MENTLPIVVNILLFWGSTEFVAFLINCSTSFRVIKDLGTMKIENKSFNINDENSITNLKDNNAEIYFASPIINRSQKGVFLMGVSRKGNLRYVNYSNFYLTNEIPKVINEDKLTYNDEVVRHKLLDFIGDVYTSGYDIVAKIEAYKNGHTLNNILIRKIFDDKENYIINT